MAMEIPTLSGSAPKFLLTKEKISRTVFGLGFAAAIVGVGTKVLPYVIRFAELGIEAGYKLTVLGIELALIGLVISFVLNPTVRNAAWYMYMGWVDAVALRVAKVKPVARVKAYVGHYLEPMGVRNQEILTNARGRQKSAQRRLDETISALEKAERRAEYCLANGSSDNGRKWHDKSLHKEFTVLSAKVRPMKDAIKRLEKRLAFQQGLVTILEDLQNVIDAYTEVTRFNVDMMVQEFESAQEAAEGSREVRGMLGSSEQTKFYNMSAQILMNQTDSLLAEVEGVMSVVQQRISEGKIDDAIGEEDLVRELMGRVGSMSTFAESQRQLAQSGEATTLFAKVKTEVLQEVPVSKPRQIGASSTDPSSRFRGLLPPSDGHK